MSYSKRPEKGESGDGTLPEVANAGTLYNVNTHSGGGGEKEPLLGSKTVVADEYEDEGERRTKMRNMRTMVAIVSFAMIGGGFFSGTQSQWIYVRFEEDTLGANFSKLNQSAASDPCFRENRSSSSSPFKADLLQAQSDTARFTVWNMLCSLLPSFFTCMVLGAYSDQLGRRLIFIVPMAGELVYQTANCAVAYWRLDVNFILIGSTINGFCGTMVALFMAVFVYTADNTSKGRDRSFGMVVSQTVVIICYCLTQLGTGYFIEAVGYVWPMVTGAGLYFIGLLSCVFCLQETLDTSKAQKVSLFEGIKGVFSFYLEKPKNPRYRRGDFVILGLVFLLFGATLGSSITTMYLMNEPLCWSARHMGYFNSIGGLGSAILSAALMKLLQTCISDEIFLAICLMSTAARPFVYAFANYDWMIYAGYAAGIMHAPILPVIRAIMSRMVRPEKRGSLFASVAVIETATIAASGAGLSELYAQTVGWWRGITFFVVGCITCASMVLILLYKIIISQRRVPEEEVTAEDPAVVVVSKVNGSINSSSDDSEEMG